MTTKRGDTAGGDTSGGDSVPPVSQKRDAFGDTKKNIGPKELVAECEAWRNRAESEKKFESFKSRPRPIG